MADPLKSDEIEDVLSSIRRLVSENHSAQVPADRHELPDRGTAADAGDLPDRLMLTPALRVAEPEDPWVPVSHNAEAAENADLEIGDGADWARDMWDGSVDAPAEEADSADLSVSDEAAQDAGIAENVAATDVAEPIEAAEPESQSPDDPDAVVEALFFDPEQQQAPDPDEIAPSLGENGEGDLIAEAMAEESDIDAASEPQPDEIEAEPTPPISFIRSTSSVADYEPEEGNTDWPVEDPPAATRDLAVARGAGIEEVETDEVTESTPDLGHDYSVDAAETPDEPADNEFAMAVEDDIESESPETADIIQVAVATEAADSDVEDLGDEPFSFPDDGDTFVDEESLRELISEVVREELQGELGVRITRNIRKLVRREIRVALAAEELE